MNLSTQNLRTKGFTLLELLIVIAIIAVLSVILVIVLNPAETIKKSRDAQRISDINTMKTALGLYLTSTTTPYLGGVAANTTCKSTPTGAYASGDAIFYSLASATDITDASIDGGATDVPIATQAATPALTDGTGWIPVNFDTLTGGSPISNLPVDPVNAVATGGSLATISTSDFFYRYACAVTPLTFEIDAQLESIAYTTSPDDKRATDGGNNANIYEVGTNLKILGTGTDF